jgi:hypothetical protein
VGAATAAGQTAGQPSTSGPVIVVVAVLAVLALVGSAVVVLSRDGGPAAVAGGRVGSASPASRDRAVRTILDRRALAVLHRDERAWLADVDPQATDFRRAQQGRVSPRR